VTTPLRPLRSLCPLRPRPAAVLASILLAGTLLVAPSSTAAGAEHGDLRSSKNFDGSYGLEGARNKVLRYRQKGQRTRLVTSKAILSVPRGAAPQGGWPIVVWGHGTTGIADRCAPTEQGLGGGPFVDDGDLRQSLLDRGYAVVQPNYEGLGTARTHTYMAGRSAGRAVLDAVLAAREAWGSLSRRVVTTGHSQGGHAAVWAAAMAPAYAPELRVRGAVALAPPNELSDQVAVLRGGPAEFGTSYLALLLRGAETVSRKVDPADVLIPRALRRYDDVDRLCLDDLDGRDSLGGVPVSRAVKEGADLRRFSRVLDVSDPGRLRFDVPVLLALGEDEGELALARTDRLAQTWWDAGTDLDYRTYPGADHAGVIGASADDVRAFVDAVM